MCTLGCIKCTYIFFQDPLSMKNLYCSLVQFNLEYCTFISMNGTLKLIEAIESESNYF